MANTKGTSVISNPKGGGAQSGLGEKFSPDLFTGTGNFSVPIAVPPGRNGFQPELTLGYSSGNGNGPFGMGWALGIPGVMRKTSKGIPIYEDKSDIFILSGAEDLVPVKIEQESLVNGTEIIGWERTFYQPRTEGLFARIIRHKKTNGEHYWEVRSKDGLISYYGTPGATPTLYPEGDPAVIANPQKRDSIFSWHLTKTVDPFGNEIVYTYARDLVIDDEGRSYDQLYLTNIHYCQYPDGAEIKYLCEVRFVYAERPDAFSAYKQGFETRMTKRCTQLETYTHATLNTKTKTYHFVYPESLTLNGATLLQAVRVEGHNGSEQEQMPPLEFSYSAYNPARRNLQEIKGSIPPVFLSEPGFELIDVTGNGIPDLLQLNGTARYWTNQGNGQFSPPKNLGISPSLSTSFSQNAESSGLRGLAFIDANGDGRTDLMVMNGLSSGYFPGAFQKVWDEKSFRPYKETPSFSLDDPEVQLMDLDGDGITDVLRNGAKFECFFNSPDKGFYKVRTAIKTFADFSFSDPRIRFADMTGDGLQDIVLISSGRVQYWPNMGYGRFGAKVNMKNAPRFPEQYNPAQILLGDLDGDGQTDIAFVENNSVTISINQSGNSFSDPVKIVNTPAVRDPKAIRIVDIMGTGQAGILWTLGGTSGTGMYFLDFTHGNKPYVLEQMNNNMGSITRVAYGSSVYHYLRDQKKPATRWKTQLPFPVQVVNRVEVLDLLSGGKLVTEYSYHNGYWDGMEREFRGFAHVDTQDTESFEKFNTQDLFAASATFSDPTSTPLPVTPNSIDSEFYSPPLLTKSWFYVGPVGDGFSRWKEPDFSDEYWPGDANVLNRPSDMIQLLANLPRRAGRDALRTLRGSMLRTELYALDGSALQDRPYTVTESRMSLREEFNPSQLPDPLWNDKNYYWSGGGYVFFPFNVAQRTTQYERGNDPMHSFSFTKEYDAYGQAQGQLSIGVPRGLVPIPGMVQYSGPYNGSIGNYLATYSLSEYIYKNESGGQYMVNRVKRSLSWDVSQSANKSVIQLRDALFAQYTDNPLDINFPVLACTVNFYDGSAFNGLAYDNMGAYGAQVRSETLIVTDAILDAAYGAGTHPPCFATVPNWSGYPTDFVSGLQDDHLGYKEKTGAPYVAGWYAESPRVKYDFQDAGLDAEEQVGRVLASRDCFDAWSGIAYDTYLLMPVRSIQYLNLYPTDTNSLITEALYDYRVMQPYQVIDANNNISVFDFSPLGLLRATALIGKGTEGDYKSSSGTFYERYAPSVRMEYDFFAFVNGGDPVWVKTISREEHYQQNPSSETITKVEYSDGFGRLLQTRVQAEDVIFGNTTFGTSGLPATQGQNAAAVGVERSGADPLNVVVSGWKLYNNKGKEVEQYEPFFDKGFSLTPLPLSGGEGGMGVKIKLFYDALGRVVKTVNPDNSQQWVIYGIPGALNAPTLNGIQASPSPWENYSYDANDLAPLTNPIGNNVAGSHWYTPKSSTSDALGRTTKTIEFFDNSNYSNTIEMNYRYDVRGNLLLVQDPYNRTVFEHVYDLRPPQKGEDGKDQPLPPLKTVHIDKGESTIVFDATGKPVESRDAKGARALSGYDVISRPKSNWARDKTVESTTLRQYLMYGDSAGLSTPESNNLKGKLYQHYDEAGLVEIPEYDFKGNVLEKRRDVIKDSEILAVFGGATVNCYRVDWTGVPSSPPAILDGFLYRTLMIYDALNRIVQMTYPEDMDGSGNEKVLVPAYNRAGALEKVELDGIEYVSHIAYNAKGQRLLVAYGNGIMNRYTYSSLTFRLQRQRSESFTESSWTYTPAGNVKQDTANEYDLMGNIVASHERTTGCGIGATDNLDRAFDYDAIYRLLSANGRENSPTLTPIWDDSYRSTDNSSTTAYTQNYQYDKLGNIQTLQHIGNSNFTRNFNYSSTNNKLNSVDIGITNYAFTYDACGNQLTETSSRHWEWESNDRARCFYVEASGSITQYTQYLYDASGSRVKKLTWKTGGIYDSISYIDSIFEYRTDGTNQQNILHVMDDRSRIASIRIGNDFGDSTPATKFNLEDHLGSSVMQLEDDGSNINREEYYPFGETSFGSYAKKRYKYCGKERDEESGLYYYGARYYAAWTCRFISVDPKAAQFPSQSPYNYCFNTPINLTDPDGMAPEGGGENPPKNNEPSTNGTNANKLPGFTPAQADPNIDTKNVRAAGVDGGAGATKMQNLKVGPTNKDKPVVGHQYPKGTFQGKAADSTPRAAASDNTTGQAGDASNPAPTDDQLMERAFEMISSSPEIQVGKGALSGSTSGEVTSGVQKNNPNLSGNLFTGEMNKVGAGGVMASGESLEYGPYAVANSVNITMDVNIQYDAALTPTAIVETGFIIQDRTAQLVGGIAETKVIVVESKTLIPSGEVKPLRTVGILRQKFISAGFNLYGFQIQIKTPRN